MKIAVYSSMFTSNYQRVPEPIYVNKNVDYLFFTDGPLRLKDKTSTVYDCPPFQLRIMERLVKNNRLESRRYKFLPHKYLPEYDWTIYHDSNVKMLADPVEIVEAVIETGRNMMLPAHPWRDCLYGELQFNRWTVPSDPQRDTDAQVARYRAEGFPEHYGMAACTFIVRNNRDPKIQEFNEFWWEEYVRAKNPRDQCCFEYCVWKTGAKYFQLHKQTYRWVGNELYLIGQDRTADPTQHITRPLVGK